MNKKIKVIDLLNMMANKQKMPQRIEYFDKVYEYNNGLYADYVYTNKNYENDYLISDHNTNILNDKVEILEDEEKIDINDIKELDGEVAYTNGIMAHCWSTAETIIVEQLNKITKYLKQNKED